MKKVLSFILCLAVVLGIMPLNVRAEEPVLITSVELKIWGSE